LAQEQGDDLAERLRELFQELGREKRGQVHFL